MAVIAENAGVSCKTKSQHQHSLVCFVLPLIVTQDLLLDTMLTMQHQTSTKVPNQKKMKLEVASHRKHVFFASTLGSMPRSAIYFWNSIHSKVSQS